MQSFDHQLNILHTKKFKNQSKFEQSNSGSIKFVNNLNATYPYLPTLTYFCNFLKNQNYVIHENKD